AGVGLGLVWAGGLSNLLDRVRDGHVVDFVMLSAGPLRTGVFNVADVAITAGVVLVLFARKPDVPRTEGT
ncbi:MAG: signal peptidase II, partial [Vicinamibacteria bacterium]